MADKTGYIGRNPNDSAVTVARQFFTASGVTTAFTFASGYLTGYLDIYVDGVKKRVADEFTATDGSTFDVLQGGVSAGSTVEAVAYKAFNATTVSGDITGNFDVSGNTTLGGSLDIVGGTTLTNLVVTGITTLGAGTSVGFANTAFNLGGTPNISVDLLSAVDINVSGAATIGGVLTYEDVTNIDSVGIVTARSGVDITANGLVVNAGVSTLAADLSIADKIVHTGDTNTAIRFPSPDTVTIETAGAERLRVKSNGVVAISTGLQIVGGGLTVTGLSTFYSNVDMNGVLQFEGSGTGRILFDADSFSGSSAPLTFWVGNSGGAHYGTIDAGNAGQLQILNTSYPGAEIDIRSKSDFSFQVNGYYSIYSPSSGGVKIYHPGSQGNILSQKFETTGSGVIVTGVATATSFVGALTGNVTGNADTATASTNVTVADESSDTTCFPLFTTAATGDLPPKSGTNLTFNSSTGALTAASFVGAVTGDVTGNADTATTATTATTSTNVTVADESSDTTCFPLFATAATGNLPPKSGTNLTFNSSTGALTATSFVGALTGAVTGNADTATTATTATNVTVADESSDTTCFPLFATAATGNLPPKSGTNLTFNSSSGALTATSFSGNGASLTSLSGSNISSGTVAAARVATLNQNTTGTSGGLSGTPNISCGTGAFSGVVTLQNNLDLQDDDKILIGTGDDLQIYHHSTYNRSYIQATGTNHDLTICGDQVTITNSAISETCALFNANGNVELRYDNSKKLETTTSGVTVTGAVSDSIGPLRRLGQNIQSSNYTLVAGDAGKQVRVGGNYTITVPDDVFSTGDMITIVAHSSSDVPITQGSGVSLYNASDGTTGNKTLAARTVCTIFVAEGPDKMYVAGGGIS